MAKPSADVVILCALPAEYRAVRRHLMAVRELTHPAGTVYEVGELGAGSRPTVALVEVGQGNPAAASACERAVSYFEPTVALFVGVAGGLKDVKLGDVVASDRVLAYESGKVAGRYLPRITSHVAAVRLVERSRAVARTAAWRRRLPDKSLLPTAFVAPIAAGEKVVASQRSLLRAFLARQCSDALAVEMEGFGFLHAAWRNPSVEALVIRGISDVLVKSEEADAQWQPTAAAHAAAFAVEVLARLDFPALSPASHNDRLTQLGIDTSSIRRRLDRLRNPVQALFGGIGSCSEVGYRGRDWNVVTLQIADEELDIFFDELLDHATSAKPVDDVERRDIDDHVRALPVHGAVLVSERPLATGEPVVGHSRLRTWVVEGCEYSDIDDQIVAAVHAPADEGTAAYQADLVTARDHLRDRLAHIRANPSPLRQIDAMVRARGTTDYEP